MSIGIPIDLGFFPTSQSPVDERYLNDSEPYADEAEVLSTVAIAFRHKYLTVNIMGVEHWFLDDLTTLQVKAYSTLQDAVDVAITDTATLFDATEVESALAEVMTAVNVVEAAVAALDVAEQDVFTLLLDSAVSVAGRIAGSVIPGGWTIAVDSVYNLMVTHTLTGRKVAAVNVFEVDGTSERMSVPFKTAYTGILGDGLTVLIEGLNPIELALRVELIFNKVA